MKKHVLLLTMLFAGLALTSCGENTSSSSSAIASSSTTSSNTNSSSDSISTDTTSSPTVASPIDVSAIDTGEKFLAYAQANYASLSPSSYGHVETKNSITTQTAITRTSKELLMDSGNTKTYTGIINGFEVYVNDNPSYPSAYSEKIDDTSEESELTTEQVLSRIEDDIKLDLAEVSLSTIISSSYCSVTIDSYTVTPSESSVKVELITTKTYTGGSNCNEYVISATLNSDLKPTSFSYTNNYYSKGKVEGATPLTTIDQFKNISYADLADTVDSAPIFDYVPYFTTAITGDADVLSMNSLYVTHTDALEVGDDITGLKVGDDAVVTPSTAIDYGTLAVTASSDETVVKQDEYSNWKCLKAGEVILTFGTPLHPSIYTKTVTVAGNGNSNPQAYLSSINTSSGQGDLDALTMDDNGNITKITVGLNSTVTLYGEASSNCAPYSYTDISNGCADISEYLQVAFSDYYAGNPIFTITLTGLKVGTVDLKLATSATEYLTIPVEIVNSSSQDTTKTIVGTWMCELTGYDEEGNENGDDVEDLIIVINEDKSGSYDGTSCTWEIMPDTTKYPGYYRYYTDEFQVLCNYDSKQNTLEIKWESMYEANYREGQGIRQA